MRRNILTITAMSLALATAGTMPAFASETEIVSIEDNEAEEASSGEPGEEAAAGEGSAEDASTAEIGATAESSREEGTAEDASVSEDALEGAAVEEYNAWQYSGGGWHYMSSGRALTGWQQLKWSGGKSWFYFDGNGTMKTGWQYLGWSGGKSWFYFDGSGAMKTGWRYLSWSGGKNWFFFNGSGAMLTGWQQLKWSGGTNYFYFNSSGAMAVNTTVDGYKVDANGARIENTTSTETTSSNGWLKKSGSWYYYKNGKAQTGWQYLGWSGGKNWFYFDGNGAMLTGWQQLSWSGGTDWFYFNSDGAMAVNTTVDGLKLDSNGAHKITQTAGYPIIPDISHWVPVADWDWVKNNCAFMISKATQGTNYVDPTLESFIKECEARGIPYWLYCYLNSGDELAQAQFMVQTCSGMVGDHFIGYILDVEADNEASGVSAALDYIKTQSSKTMIYIGRSYYRQSAFKEIVDSRGDNCAWWEARYGKNDGNYPDTSQYSIDSGVDLHQYTSQGKLEGFSRSVDLSRIVGGKSLQWYTTK